MTSTPKPKARWSGKLEASAIIGGGIATLWTELVVYQDQLISAPRWQPEMWFMAAMLSDAAHALHNQKERRWVVEWLNNEWDSPCPFSLVCSSLHLDEQYVRRTLLARGAGRKARALA